MNGRLSHFFRYRFPAILWAIVIFIASSIPGAKLPKIAHLINDKIIHISIFFILGVLVYRALEPPVREDKFDWRRLFISIVAVVLYGVTDEFHQYFVPGRSVDILDASADTAGGILAALAIYLNFRWKMKKLSIRHQ